MTSPPADVGSPLARARSASPRRSVAAARTAAPRRLAVSAVAISVPNLAPARRALRSPRLGWVGLAGSAALVVVALVLTPLAPDGVPGRETLGAEDAVDAVGV